MTEASKKAYGLAGQGYGWEDIELQCPSLPKSRIWEILLRVHAQKAYLARVPQAQIIPIPSLKKEKGNHLHG